MDFVRNLTNKIFGIIKEILPFFMIVAIFLVCFTNIFYLTKFYSNEDRPEAEE